jgi:hypothetical protein
MFKSKFLKQADNLLTTKNRKTQKPYKPQLTTSNPKTLKSIGKGYLTGIMHLAPSTLCGVGDVCPGASPECKAMCLNRSGMGNMPTHQKRRVERTQLYFQDRPKFLEELRRDIRKLIRQADKKGLTPAVRINGTSDLPQLAVQMAEEFPEVQFYDYTAVPRPWRRTKDNYHVTFSRKENNEKDAMAALKHGINVAVVFDAKKGESLPETWRGYPVVDGDLHDLRFLDSEEFDGPVIVGLHAKGKARGKGKATGFIVPVTQGDSAHTRRASSEETTPVHVEYYREGMFS